MPLKPRLKRERVLFIFLLLLFLLLRIYKLGNHDFWFDEIATIDYARYPWWNRNAPLYWIALHFWIKLFGVSETVLRIPSLIFSFLSVIIIFFLGKELFNKRTAVIAASIMGFSPFHLWYAQEARDYSMVLFVGLVSSWLLHKAINRGGRKLWISFALVSVIGLYTNYFYMFLLLAHASYIIFSERPKLNPGAAICFLSIILSFSLYLARFLDKFLYVRGGFWIPRPQWGSLIITLENFILGYGGFDLLYGAANTLAGVSFICALAAAYIKKDLRKNLTLCLLLFFIPVAAVFLFSRLFFSIYLDRGLIIFSPYLYLILSLGISFFSKKIRTASLVILASLLFMADYRYFKEQMCAPLAHHTGTYIKKPIKPAVVFLRDNLASQDMIAFTNKSTMPSLRFYSQGGLPGLYYIFDPKLFDSDWQRPVEEDAYCVPFYKVNNLKFKRLWVIASDWERSGGLDENSEAVKNWLDGNLRLEFVRNFEGLWLFRYAR